MKKKNVCSYPGCNRKKKKGNRFLCAFHSEKESDRLGLYAAYTDGRVRKGKYKE